MHYTCHFVQRLSKSKSIWVRRSIKPAFILKHPDILKYPDYCNCLLTSVPQAYMKRLQSLQNWAARIIFKLDRRHESSPLLKSLHF